LRPVVARTFISAPREEIFDFVADYAGRVAWMDHCLEDYRLARVNSYGQGAAASFRIAAPLFPLRAEFQVTQFDRPRRIGEQGRIGRVGRIAGWADWEFEPAQGGTEVTLTVWTEPATRLDALKEALGGRLWLRRQLRMGLSRLRLIFEERPERPLARATIAGYEPLKAARFGA
jgi:Polyketide cyclase / dehydrase and lipid transport